MSAQRGGASPATVGRSQSRRADAVQVRRETLPRPLLRQQAQLVSSPLLSLLAGIELILLKQNK